MNIYKRDYITLILCCRFIRSSSRRFFNTLVFNQELIKLKTVFAMVFTDFRGIPWNSSTEIDGLKFRNRQLGPAGSTSLR